MATDDDVLFERSGEFLDADELKELDLEVSENRRLRDVYLEAIAKLDGPPYVYVATKRKGAGSTTDGGGFNPGLVMGVLFVVVVGLVLALIFLR
jgi:hypothetical protein